MRRSCSCTFRSKLESSSRKHCFGPHGPEFEIAGAGMGSPLARRASRSDGNVYVNKGCGASRSGVTDGESMPWSWS